VGRKAQIVLVIFTPKEKVRQIVSEKYGKITYELLGENESLGGIISTRNSLLRVRSNGQTYEFENYGRPIFNPDKVQIELIAKSRPTLKEKIKRRKKYVEYAQISGPEIKDYSKTLGEFGGNPKVEPTTKQIRLIYSVCKECDIPIWICDTLEPVLSWGSINKGLTRWLKENYQKYLGLPLYKIPAIDFSKIEKK